MSVTVRDRGYSALMARLKKVNPTEITVGIHEEEGGAAHDEGGMTVAEIGAVHEFGLGDSPRRSFIADWAEQNRADHDALIRKSMNEVLAGRQTIDTAAERLGARLEAEVKRRITQTPGDWEPLNPETIARKGSSKPLIDTGALRGAITYKVHKGG